MYYLLMAVLAAANVVVFIDQPEGNWISPLAVGFVLGMAFAKAMFDWLTRKIRR